MKSGLVADAFRSDGFPGAAGMRTFVAAIATLAFAGAAQAATKLTMDYTVGKSVTAFAAKEAGFFAKHGLDVELVQVTQNSNAPAALESGSLQVGMIQIANLLQAADGGLDFVAIAGGSDNEKGKSRFSVVVRTGLPVTTAQDLVGKKVGVPGIGASIDTFFRNWLLDNGVDPASVNITETTFLAMADNLKAGNLDAVTPLEPFVTRIIEAGIGTELVNLVDRLPHPTLNALIFVTKRDWAEQITPRSRRCARRSSRLTRSSAPIPKNRANTSTNIPRCRWRS